MIYSKGALEGTEKYQGADLIGISSCPCGLGSTGKTPNNDSLRFIN